jgi:hypothetical protein
MIFAQTTECHFWPDGELERIDDEHRALVERLLTPDAVMMLTTAERELERRVLEGDA